MDSPLNSSHQQGRIADSFVKSGKFEEAIACHHRAAEYLLDALKLTRCPIALQAIQLQHAHHLKMSGQLCDKQRRKELLQIQQNKSQCVLKSQAVQTDVQGPIIPSSYRGDHWDHSTFQTYQRSDHGPAGSDADVRPEYNDTVYHTLTENDSLIGLLIRRRQNLDGQDLNSYHSGVPVERVFHREANPKEDQAEAFVKEDLRSYNDDLRKHVCQLLHEVEGLKKEKKELQEKLDHYNRKENSETLFHDMGGSGIEVLPELPPLEMPTFDLDLLLNEKSHDESISSKSAHSSHTQ